VAATATLVVEVILTRPMGKPDSDLGREMDEDGGGNGDGAVVRCTTPQAGGK